MARCIRRRRRMKKKTAVLILCFCMLPCMLFAAEYSWMDGLIGLDLVPSVPLFEDIKFDPLSMSTSLRYLNFLNESAVPKTVRGIKYDPSDSQNGEYVDVVFNSRNRNGFLNMKLGLNQGLLRMAIGPVEAEFNLQGGLNTIFDLNGGSTALGFDGMYQIGLNMSIFDFVDLTFGMHHFSGHLGDELIEDLKDSIAADSSFAGYRFQPLEYVRDNSWVFGVSVSPLSFLRVYGIAALPKKSSWIRPYVHVPEGTLAPSGNDTMQEHSDNQEHVEGSHNAGDSSYDDSYKAWDIQTGLEISLPIWSVGSIYAAANLQLHQDGQTKHMLGQYSKDNPWDWEVSAGLGIALNKTGGGTLSLEAFYHKGRLPLLNMFYTRAEYLSLGINIAQ
jgi:hypothetical protein